MKSFRLYSTAQRFSTPKARGALPVRLLALWLLLGQPALARYGGRGGDPGWTDDLFKLAPPGALLAMACVLILIGLLFYAAKRSSGTTKNSFFAMALLMNLPLLGLVVWYQPVVLLLPVSVALLFSKGSK